MDEEKNSSLAETPGKASSMTIGDAKKLFTQYGEVLQPDYRQLAKQFRTHGIGWAISNSNYLHALSLTELILQNTRKNLRMLTGSISSGLPGGLRDSFLTMLARIRRNGGQAWLIVVDGDVGDLRQFQRTYSDTLKVIEATAPDSSQVGHFIVGDGNMLRDEQPHATLTDQSDANLIKAEVYFANKAKAASFTRKFDAIWASLAPEPA